MMPIDQQSGFDVAIIGAGHNGLVAAGYLARAGRRVVVLERRDIVGGAVTTEELIPGYRFSACSFLCYAFQPQIVHDLEMRRYGFEVFELEPLEMRPFPDGRHIVLYRDEARNVEAIRRFSEHDAEAYPRWNAFWERASSIVNPYRLRTPPTLAQLFEDVRGTDLERVLEQLVTRSFADMLDEWFESDVVKAALVHSGDVGDPRGVGTAYPSANLAGGSMDVVADVGNTVGIVRGGMGSITAALQASAEAHGADIRTGAEVERVLVEGGRAVGVRLAGGEVVRARAVVSNADPKRTFLSLVDAADLPADFRASVARLSTRVSYLKFHAAMRELPDFSRFLGQDYDPRVVARVWINPSVAYYEQAWRDADGGEPSRAPVMSIQIPSTYDPSVAPPGQAHPVDLRDVRACIAKSRHLGRASAGDRRAPDRRRLRVRAELPRCNPGLAAVHAARPRAPRRPVGRQHPPPRHGPVAAVRLAAPARLVRLPDADPRPVALRGGHAPGRRGVRHARPQRGPCAPRRLARRLAVNPLAGGTWVPADRSHGW